jgi:hypothetical protein
MIAAVLVKLFEQVKTLELDMKVAVPVPLAAKIQRLGLHFPLPHGLIHGSHQIVRVFRGGFAVKSVKH